MSKGWTKERRAKRAADCKASKPWQHATGPKTTQGKAHSSRNATTHGMYAAPVQHLRQMLTAQRRFVRALLSGESPQNPLYKGDE